MDLSVSMVSFWPGLQRDRYRHEPTLIQIKVPVGLVDRLFLGLPERFLEPLRQRVPPRLLRLDRLLEQRLAPRLLLRQDAVRVVDLRLVGALRLDMPDDPSQALIDHQHGLAARTG